MECFASIGQILHLHSTMLLLYPFQPFCHICLFLFIYIPLCFYFIDLTTSAPSIFIFIYIPLCFYFIACFPSRTSWVISFTFHYASTLSQCWCKRIQDRSCIYIPLCFYFIGWCGDERDRCIVNLHSTMLLLYRFSLPQQQNSCPIYIPLCFYFIELEKREISSEIEFTFHYASTLSSMSRWEERRFKKFTFHYASTLSEQKLQLIRQTKYLHSTILLLYRKSRKMKRMMMIFTFHYASTLSCAGRATLRIKIQFTFHYASTLSQLILYFFQCSAHLHSTMLLLYQTCLFPVR